MSTCYVWTSFGRLKAHHAPVMDQNVKHEVVGRSQKGGTSESIAPLFEELSSTAIRSAEISDRVGDHMRGHARRQSEIELDCPITRQDRGVGEALVGAEV